MCTLNNSEIRHRIRLRVELTGVDSTGHPFKQITHNVSKRGARLEEAPPLLEPTSVVQLDHQGKKGRSVLSGLEAAPAVKLV